MEIFETKVVDIDHIEFHNPVIIGGFVGNTLTGFIAASYIIERLQMHQVAHVKSPHIPPIAVFIGKKLRTPFRIYSNKAGTLVVATGELFSPLSALNLHLIDKIGNYDDAMSDLIKSYGLGGKIRVYAPRREQLTSCNLFHIFRRQASILCHGNFIETLIIYWHLADCNH